MPLDFPSSPTNGQTYGNYYYDGPTGAWRSFSSTVNPIPSTLKNLTISSDSTTGVSLSVTPFTTSSVNLQEWYNTSSNVVASMNVAGELSVSSLTLGTDLSVANGGTGASSFTSGAYLKGAGTAAITAQTGIPAGDITSGTLGVARGGTGVATLTGYAKGSGTSAFSAVTTIPVADGGTGATTLTSGGYLKGAGTSAITSQTGIPAGDINSGTLSEARLPSGTVIQSVFYTYSTYTTGTGTTYVDIHSGTRPAITAKRSDSRFIVLASMNWLQEGTRRQVLRMLRNGSVVGQEQIFATAIGSGWTTANMFFQWHDTTARTAGTTYTFSFQSAVSAGTWYYNYNFSGLNGVSTYTILEVVN